MTMKPDSGLTDKVALVTGGSRGIGRAIVETLAADGADVVFVYRGAKEAADAVVADSASRGWKVCAEQGDVRDAAQCEALVEKVVNRHGTIDILVNNAGVVRDGLLAMLSADDVREVIETNLVGTMTMSRAVVPIMISRRSGSIVNLSSVAASKGGRGQSNYAASKGGIEAFTRSLAVELASRRIRVNAVAPGVIETEMSQAVRDLAGDQVLARILLKRYGQPQEVANAVWFLASQLAGYVTGEVLHVDGGFKMD
jgi:3-oxoacyl-[acyl-carrier protein] reductase